MNWEQAEAAALKILGKDAKIPQPKKSWGVFEDEQAKAKANFEKSRSDLEDKILALENQSSIAKNNYGQFSNVIEQSEFGLNAKNQDDAKKIAQARKVISDWIENQTKSMDMNIKMLNELDKHLVGLQNYKG